MIMLTIIRIPTTAIHMTAIRTIIPAERQTPGVKH